jgi:calcium-dependent protein kinase
VQAVVGHPHVVALRAVYEDVHSLHMIMDWCGGGTLWHLMERCPDYQLPEAAAAAATRATLMVLAHCHAR